MGENFVIATLKNRIAILEGRGNKNVKAPGVLRKVKRQLRNELKKLG